MTDDVINSTRHWLRGLAPRRVFAGGEWGALFGGRSAGLVIVIAPFFVGPAIVFATSGLRDGVSIAVELLAIAAATCAFIAGVMLARFVADAHQTRIPRVAGPLARGLAAAVLATTAAPAMLLLSLHGSTYQAGMIVNAGLACLLAAAVGPQLLFWGLAPVLLMWNLEFLRTPLLELSNAFRLTERSLLVTILLLAGNFWRWRVLISAPPKPPSDWRLFNQTALSLLRARIADHALAAKRYSPTDAIRMFLGEPYAPTGTARRMLQLALILALCCLLPTTIIVFGSQDSLYDVQSIFHLAWRPCLLVTFFAVWAGYLSRVMPRSGRDADLNELALLPSLGDAAAQRRHLYHAVVTPLLLALVVCALAAFVVGRLDHASMQSQVRLACVLGYGLSLTLPQLWGLLRRRATPGFAPRLSLFLVPLLSCQLFLTTLNENIIFGRWSLNAIFIGVCCLVTGFIVFATVHSVRQLASRPHPFVEVSA